MKTDEFIRLKNKYPLLDLRSPKEFNNGHIPGAVNLPLFSDEERHQTGIIYKQHGRQKAIYKGLDYIGPKMRKIAETATGLSVENKVLIHCWRGGMRSRSVAWLLNFCGLEAIVLDGGYKEYRKFVLNQFKQKYNLLIIGGYTGSLKTKYLYEFSSDGFQIIDIEALAAHKGSAFGGYNQSENLSQEQFENDMAEELNKLNPEKLILVEDESRTLGRVTVPNDFYLQMKNARVIFIDLDIRYRIKNIISDYGNLEKEFLIRSINKISKRLGGLRVKEAVEAVEINDLETACQIILSYYDKAYLLSLSKRNNNNILKLELNSDNFSQNFSKIKESILKI